ncbi:unnamed protein product [Cyberlindnera jadinii]|uniref:Uncharacterized protein n=1 Tax=Cyberlindnera jadinii (strain ATCC 18201 / CBS 1600 / BCRC 20928 / JCM 3617 / NBRC 0987 / NRRL Y-1542) TaxID=983966 RepID=A0A0H5CII5_CYBJN|nr:unnamed protein product [Cyberlindnera jadinii]
MARERSDPVDQIPACELSLKHKPISSTMWLFHSACCQGHCKKEASRAMGGACPVLKHMECIVCIFRVAEVCNKHQVLDPLSDER